MRPCGPKSTPGFMVGRAISAHEQSLDLNPFTFEHDYYLADLAELTAEEAWGLELLEGKAMCSACRVREPGEGGMPPRFTDCT